ncbi:hypothetical protein HDV05_002529 [Chytridiales sp. JEL 0842]|nr:hypothetical protein HDV05_002529 [Chytridiales sp. JEL 0842]
MTQPHPAPPSPTPLLPSPLNPKVFYKLDNLQPPQSFKLRGIFHLVSTSLFRNPSLRTLVSSSGGNAGLATAYVAQLFNLQCIVFVPTTTGEAVVKMLEKRGAEVRKVGGVWDVTHTHALAHLKELNEEQEKGLMVHPFDHELLWEGHASIVSEIYSQIPAGLKVGALICAVGGGGLLAGVLHGLLTTTQNTSSKPKVLALETAGAASFNAALTRNNGKPVKIEKITSVAKSLGALQVCEGVLRLRESYGEDLVKSVVVSDEQALKGVVKFFDETRSVGLEGYCVEPACGAGLAVVYEDSLLKDVLSDLKEDEVVVVVVCGGAASNVELVEGWRREVGL